MTRNVSEGGYVGPKLGAEEKTGWDENDLGDLRSLTRINCHRRDYTNHLLCAKIRATHRLIIAKRRQIHENAI